MCGNPPIRVARCRGFYLRMTSFTRSNGHGHYSSTPNATRMGTRSHTWVESLQTEKRFCITPRLRGHTEPKVGTLRYLIRYLPDKRQSLRLQFFSI